MSVTVQGTTAPNIYKYRVSMKLIVNNGYDVYDIDNYNIKSVVIDSNYLDLNMPLIFVTASISKKIIDLMVLNQDNAKIILNIQRTITNSDIDDIFTNYISKECIYLISEDINKMDQFDYSSEDNSQREDTYKLTSIGLLCLDHVNNNKKVVNGVFNGDLSSIMYYLVSHMPVLMEPPKQNPKMEIYIPPTNSVLKSLEYLNGLHVFYQTPFMFFIDFDCTYLMSTSGKGIYKKGEKINDVQITLRNTYDEGSKTQGMIVDEYNSIYYIEIDGTDAELSDAHLPDKSFTKISGTSSDGTSINSTIESFSKELNAKTKAVRIANGNTGLIDNMTAKIKSKTVQLMVQKTDLNPEVLTPNKRYYVNTNDVYNSSTYDGSYLLARKRELYIREDENFTMSTMLLLNKL